MMDSHKEEEDHYDKVAVGREKAGDECLYVTTMDDYGIDIDSGNEIPNSFEDVARDPRVNHLAAKIRLKEDAEATKKLDSLRVTVKENISVSDNSNLKSILKRKKDFQLDSKTIAFTPKKKIGAVAVTDNCVDSKQNQDDASEDFKLKRGVPLWIAVVDDLDTETCAMEEDKPETAANRTSSRRPDRQYRTKPKLET